MEKIINDLLPFIKQRCKHVAMRYKIDNGDLLSCVLYKAWSFQHLFDLSTNETGFKKWIQIIIRNEAINIYRSNNRYYYVDSPSYCLQTWDDVDLIEYIQGIVKKRFNGEFRIMEMMLEGYKYQEISKELNVPEGSIKNFIFRMRKFIKSKI